MTSSEILIFLLAIDFLSGSNFVWSYLKWMYMLIGSKFSRLTSIINVWQRKVMPDAKFQDISQSSKRKRQDSVISQASGGTMLWKGKSVARWMQDIIASFLLGIHALTIKYSWKSYSFLLFIQVNGCITLKQIQIFCQNLSLKITMSCFMWHQVTTSIETLIIIVTSCHIHSLLRYPCSQIVIFFIFIDVSFSD